MLLLLAAAMSGQAGLKQYKEMTNKTARVSSLTETAFWSGYPYNTLLFPALVFPSPFFAVVKTVSKNRIREPQLSLEGTPKKQ